MVETKENFFQRLSLVERKHAKMSSRGYYTRIDKNGVLVVKAKRNKIYFPARGLFLLAFSFFAFKAFMLSANGPDTYQDRLVLLQNGTVIEALGAKVLAIDPATQLLANQIGPLLR